MLVDGELDDDLSLGLSVEIDHRDNSSIASEYEKRTLVPPESCLDPVLNPLSKVSCGYVPVVWLVHNIPFVEETEDLLGLLFG